MADFDPDKFLAETAPPAQGAAFDPDKFLAETAPVAKQAKSSLPGALMRGAAQGSSLGFADELYGLVGAAANPMNSDKGFWDRYHQSRDYARGRDATAEAEHPTAFTVGQLGGGLATAVLPGASALNVGKGAGLIEAGAKGAALGALSGSGQAKEITDVPEAAIRGAGAGAVIGGGLNALGKVGSAVIDKLKPAKIGSVLLNAPESALQRYIDDSAAVNAARPRSDIVQDTFLPRLDTLQNEVVNGSQASRAILTKEGKVVTGDKIADILDGKANEILERSEGVMDDPRKIAAVNFLKDTAKKYQSKIPDDVTTDLAAKAGVDPGQMMAEKQLQLSTNRVKDLIQTLDNMTEYETAPGRFARMDDGIKRDVRGQIDKLLKDSSDAYKNQMKSVASDSALLSEVSGLAKSPQGFDNLLKRTQRGSTPQMMDALERFDKRTGGGLLQELQDSAVKDALNRGAIHGSRNELLHGGMASAIGEGIGGLPGKVIGQTLGLLGGATVDKYGPAIARKLVDNAANVQKLLDSSPGVQALGPVLEGFSQSNVPLALTQQYLKLSDPQREAIQRRIGGH